MADIALIGLNHKTAPVEIRECLAFSGEETTDALKVLRKHPAIDEVVLISTCNRVEVLITANDKSKAVEATKSFLSEFKKVPHEKFQESLYIHYGDEAVRHIFRVASRLD